MLNINSYQNPLSKTELVEAYGVLVKKIAYHLLARLPASVLVDDLIQSGMIGLFEAYNNFDPSKGASFDTFAGIRIRGSMLDEMRRGDWTPRSVHRNSRLVSDAIKMLSSRLGRDPIDQEVAEYLEISLDDYHQILLDVSNGKILEFNDMSVNEDKINLDDSFYAQSTYQEIERQAFKEGLTRCIATLPERESLVLSLYYDEELNLKAIGEVIDVSESRVSQILSQAMHRLKAKMQDWSHDV
ncbi:MAG: RNA polymerase sigma factor FliA [Colwellia sp.]